uniref:FBA_2 domain-containing protein n=1 Tax=Caenorhabditis tropicalis TaxID=1561998 RepID=A0A1I7UAD7_9PELO
MSDFTGFTLLNLPVVPGEDIIRLMTVQEQYKLATLSNVTRRVVKSASFTEKMEWMISYTGVVMINIKNHSRQNEYVYRLRPTPGTDFVQTVKDEIAFIRDVFNFSSLHLSFLDDTEPNLLFSVISFVKELDINLDEVRICSSVPSNIMNKILLHECASAKDFKLTYEITGDFEMKFWECPKFKNKSIQISEAQWIKSRILNNCFMDCESVVLSKCDVSPSDLNSFLKKWIHGAALDEIIISLRQRVDRGASMMDRVLRGIPADPINFARLYQYQKEFEDGTCFIIHQNSGKPAIVYQMNQDFCLSTNFSLDLSEPDPEELEIEFSVMIKHDEDFKPLAVNARDDEY